MVRINLEHQPEPDMDFISTREAGVNVKEMLECLDGPETHKMEEKFSTAINNAERE